MAHDPARRLALDVLCAVRERGAYANLLLPQLMRERRLPARNRAFAPELTYGAPRIQMYFAIAMLIAAGVILAWGNRLAQG